MEHLEMQEAAFVFAAKIFSLGFFTGFHPPSGACESP